MSTTLIICILLALLIGFGLWRLIRNRRADTGNTDRATGGLREPRNRNRDY